MPTDSKASAAERSPFIPKGLDDAARRKLKAALLDEWQELVYRRELRPAGTAPGRSPRDDDDASKDG